MQQQQQLQPRQMLVQRPTATPAHSQESSQPQSRQAQHLQQTHRNICRFYRQGTCKHGLTGRNCPQEHPRPCRRLMKHGNHSPQGRACEYFHPKMCPTSLSKRECFKADCKLKHIMGTKWKQPAVSQDRHQPRRRRHGRDSGGVALYLRDDLASTAEPIFNLSNWVVEALGVHGKAENLVLIVLYRQPDDLIGRHRSTSAEFRQTLRELRSALNSLPSPTPDVIMCGDFNLPHVSWPGGTPCTGASREEKTMAQDLSELMEEHVLFQQIPKSTHKRGNVLDLCFCNNPDFSHSYQCTETALSDRIHRIHRLRQGLR